MTAWAAWLSLLGTAVQLAGVVFAVSQLGRAWARAGEPFLPPKITRFLRRLWREIAGPRTFAATVNVPVAVAVTASGTITVTGSVDLDPIERINQRIDELRSELLTSIDGLRAGLGDSVEDVSATVRELQARADRERRDSTRSALRDGIVFFGFGTFLQLVGAFLSVLTLPQSPAS